MNKNILLVLVAMLIVGGGAYWALANRPADTGGPVANQMPVVTSGDGVEPGSGGIHGMEPEPAAAKARADLAARLAVSQSAITIMLVEDKTWNDGCLGLGGPAESCLQALTDGFRVELLAQGKTYVYRTDKTGASVRAETQI